MTQDFDDTKALRGAALTFVADPFVVGAAAAVRYEPDALVVIRGGRIEAFGAHNAVTASLHADMPVTHYTDSLILPGFIDAHVHYPQTQMIGAFGKQLTDWLTDYAFPAEQMFADKEHARVVAKLFLRECLRAGTTTAAVYCTVFPDSVDAFFEEAERLDMRMIAGKVLMDRNAPAALTDNPHRGYDDSKALLQRWHKRGRLLYAITPRFAVSSSPAQMEMAGALWKEFPDAYLQSHISENVDEVAWARKLYPERSGYLDVYDHYGHLGPRAIFGHGIHLTEDEFQRFHDTGTAIAHCPTSNLFLGSGLFRLGEAKRAGRPVRIALATDLGGGTSFSQLQTMNEAYKVAQLGGFSLSAAHAYYLATRGAAEALYLDNCIGSIAPGFEADLTVLDLRSTPLIDYRTRHCRNLEEALFIQMILGDDRAIRATYVAGHLLHDRDRPRQL